MSRGEGGLEEARVEKQISPLRCASVEMTILSFFEGRKSNGKAMRDKNKDNSRSLRDDKKRIGGKTKKHLQR
jgi:hypothetical protein